MLKIRCEEFRHLEPFKDFLRVQHVAIESAHTMTGIKKKPQMTMAMIEEYNIEWRFLNEHPHSDPWINERLQRDEMKTTIIGLGVQDDDTVLISDVDEVPRAYALQHYRPAFGFCALQMDVYCFHLNSLSDRQKWTHPRIMPWSYLKDKSPEDIRRAGFNMALVQAGWHFTYMGTTDQILTKLKSFPHQEKSVQEKADKALLEAMMGKNVSFWGTPMETAPITDMPYYVQSHKEEFKNLLL